VERANVKVESGWVWGVDFMLVLVCENKSKLDAKDYR
jgi:hypothetical protein